MSVPDDGVRSAPRSVATGQRTARPSRGRPRCFGGRRGGSERCTPRPHCRLGRPRPWGGRSIRPEGGADDRGAVTVEAALALSSLVLVLALAVTALAATAASVRCLDASRELARLAARGEPERGRAVAAELAPAGARLELARAGDTVTAEVSIQLIRPLPMRIGGRAVAAVEPGVPPP
jgi:hypothetical protein